MKINVARTAKKNYTHISFIEKGVERFVEKGGATTLLIPSGKISKVTPRTLRTLVRGVVQSAKKYKLAKIALTLSYADFTKCHEYDERWFFATVAENLILADYEHTAYKSKKAKYALEEVTLVVKHEAAVRDFIAHGITLATYTNLCRDLGNISGSDMTPQILATRTKDIFKGTKVGVTVFDEKKMASLGMGGVLGIGKGSKHKPRFIVVEYKGGKKGEKPIVFVGKGVTFDMGGLQIKPGMSMYEMHMDMLGGAAVIAAIRVIASLKLKKNIVGLIPAVENGVGEDAIRPGDVLTTLSGTTVEVLHTDAEGRIILADALHYARKYDPALVIDVATLTGASLIAVGQHASVIMTKNRALEDTLRNLGEESGDYVVPLPLWDEYTQYIKGTHADITNVPSGDSRNGGTINAGMFLAHFTKKMRWVHIDMAPRMTSVPSDKLAKGATGEPTRLLVKIAEKL